MDRTGQIALGLFDLRLTFVGRLTFERCACRRLGCTGGVSGRDRGGSPGLHAQIRGQVAGALDDQRQGSSPKGDPIVVRENRRYRLRFDNRSDDDHPVHLHRHSFELKEVAGKSTAGIFKDVVVVPGMKTVEVELLANKPGETLFHCHNQQHMDFGFMTMMHYAD